MVSYSIKKRIRTGIAVCVVIGVIAAAAIGLNKFFTITNIVVVGTDLLIEFDQEKIQKNLLFFSPSVFESEILKQYPQIETVEFTKKIPHTIMVHINLRKPIAYISQGNDVYTIDSEGMVIERVGSHNNSLPVLTFDVQMVSIGRKIIDTRITQSLIFLRLCQEKISFVQLSAYDTVYVQAQFDQTNVLISPAHDMKEKADTLQTLISGFRMKGTLPRVIDLRFDKPIITV